MWSLTLGKVPGHQVSWEELGHHSLVCSTPQKALPQYQHRSPLLSFRVTKCDVVLGRPSLTTYPTCNPHLPFPILLFSLAFVTIGHTLFYTNVFIPRLCPPQECKLHKSREFGVFLFLIVPQCQEWNNECRRPSFLPSAIFPQRPCVSLVFPDWFHLYFKTMFHFYI